MWQINEKSFDASAFPQTNSYFFAEISTTVSQWQIFKKREALAKNFSRIFIFEEDPKTNLRSYFYSPIFHYSFYSSKYSIYLFCFHLPSPRLILQPDFVSSEVKVRCVSIIFELGATEREKKKLIKNMFESIMSMKSNWMHFGKSWPTEIFIAIKITNPFFTVSTLKAKNKLK